MRGKTASVGLVAGFVVVFTVGGESVWGQTAKPQEAGLPWTKLCSLGKMWEWHTLLGVSSDGTKLLLGGYSKILAVYDLSSGKVVHVVRTKESVQDAAFSPDGKLLAVAEWRDGVTLRDATTMQVVQRLNGSDHLGAWQARFSRDGRRLVGYSWWGQDKQLWSYDFQAKREIGWPAGKNVDTANRYMREGLRGWGSHLFSVETTSDNGYYTGYRVWVTDAETGKAGAKIELGDKDYFQFDIDPEGGRAIVMQPGEDPRVVDLKTGKTVFTLAGHQRWATCAAFSPDGKFIATASGTTEDASARVYTKKYGPHAAPTEIMLRDAATGKVIATVPGAEKSHDYTRIGFSPDSKYLWSQTNDRELRLWGGFPALPAKVDPLPNFNSEIPPKKTITLPIPTTGFGDRFEKLIQELTASQRTREQKVEALFLAVLGSLPTAIEQVLALKGHEKTPFDTAALSRLSQMLVASPDFVAHVMDLQNLLPNKDVGNLSGGLQK